MSTPVAEEELLLELLAEELEEAAAYELLVLVLLELELELDECWTATSMNSAAAWTEAVGVGLVVLEATVEEEDWQTSAGTLPENFKVPLRIPAQASS